MSALEKQNASFETYPPEERIVDEAFNRPLIQYVEYVIGLKFAIIY